LTTRPPKSSTGIAIAGANVFAATKDSALALIMKPSADALITFSSSAKYYMKKAYTVEL
jgi:hypothetical protein